MTGWFWLLAFVAEPVPAHDVAVSERSAETLKINILVKQPQKCDRGTSDEIVVCADNSDDESQRLRPIANAEIYDKDESRAEFGISENVRLAAEVDSADLGAGMVSKRIMARVKIKF